MIIERKNKEILLKISPNVDKFGMEKILEYIEYLELTSNSKAKQKDADELAEKLNKNWWEQNKDRFLNK
jgi:predicted trehalose synthase